MLERIKIIQERYDEINKELVNPEVISNVEKTKVLGKELSGIKEIVAKGSQYQKITDEITEVEEMLKDKELGEFAKEELDRLNEIKSKLEEELELLLIPKDENDDKNVIIEIRGAAGGNEANIFAGDLFRMYSRYCDRQGWNTEVLNEESSESGGFSEIIFKVKGKNVYSKLKYESGAHRVQRVPVTESSGRVHTSTSTVLVMPEVEDLKVEINPNDLRIDIYRSSGKGGQSVNTTDSAVRITHLPTGIVVTCQNERSQIQNKETAMQVLRARIYEDSLSKRESELEGERRTKIGTGDRSEKIRTYNYAQNRVTDHRISFSLMSLDKVMGGELEEIIQALITEDQRRKLSGE